MMIVKNSEWLLAEVGVEEFIFVNQVDKTVKLSVQRCRYVLKDKNYVVNLIMDDDGPSIEFTTNTERRIAPSMARVELSKVLDYLKQTCTTTTDMFRLLNV